MAEGKSVELGVTRFEETPVDADPALIREMLLILLDNAIKFTPAGGKIELSIAMNEGSPTLVVGDTGIGISTDDLPHIFDRFYRGERGRKGGNGAGLGLSIARWIAKEHKATINVKSEPEHGTMMTVVFPPSERATAAVL